MTRKIIIDCDPGIDDAIALTMALFDPELEVIAVTSTAGNVDAHQASRNVQAIIERLDPPRRPRLGHAEERQATPTVNAMHMHGDDGLGNMQLPVSELHRHHGSDKVLIDCVHNSPGDITILALGPLTNIASALKRDPGFASQVDRIVMTGGAINGIGNVTAAAEFNMYCDPEAARTVFRSPVTKTLIPLDVTRQIVMDYGFMDQLPDENSRAGQLLRHIVPFLFRSYRQSVGFEGIHVHDVVPLVAVTQPSFFQMEEMAGDVETSGQLTQGCTVFDRRRRPEWRANMEVAKSLDVDSVKETIVQTLRFAGHETK